MRLALALVAAAAAGAALAQPQSCRVAGIRNEVLCGSVQRPLDPALPQGAQIAVHYVVVPATARRKLPDAVAVLAGGPGQSAIDVAPALLPLLARLNYRRDLVFVDQRGTGRSTALACDELRAQPLGADLGEEERRLRECRDRLAQTVGGADGLRHFTTWVASQDLEAVRRQLGGVALNLVGFSYGTRAALDFLRQHPQGVRRMVLDGVAPPDMALPEAASADAQAVFDALLAACAAEPACRRDHATLAVDWQALLARLPLAASVRDPASGTPERITLTRELLLQWVRAALLTPWIAAALPVALHDAAQGHLEGLAGLAALVEGRRSDNKALAMGMHLSVVCAEDAPRAAAGAETPGADFGTVFAERYRRLCAAWPRGEVPAAFYAIAPSPVPVLLLSGGLDPATPPRHGARVALALGPKAQHVVVANAGHGVLGIGCARELLFRFIDAADAPAPLDAECLLRIPRPAAFVPPGRGQ